MNVFALSVVYREQTNGKTWAMTKIEFICHQRVADLLQEKPFG